MKKIVLLAFILVLLSTPIVVGFVRPVAASLPVHNLDTLEYFGAIQAALDDPDTLDGHTIRVDSGTYYEHVVVNKSLTLVGEDRSTTVIDGNRIGLVIRSNAPDVEIRGFTVQNGGDSPNSGILIGKRGVGNTIHDCIIRNNAYGITLMGSDACSIIGNIIMNNSWAGIRIVDSSNNDILNNIIVDNSIGVYITTASSVFNTFYRNNFIGNSNHALSSGLNTKWDNGVEGNYWDDYLGEDSNGDGIGDTLIPHLGLDEYPLMEPWNLFRTFRVVPWNQNVTTFCNATVASFKFNQSLKQISFNVTGPSGVISLCNVTIPKNLLRANATHPWMVKLDGAEITNEATINDNATHTFIYFTFEFQSTCNIKVIGTWVVPEFPTWTSMLLVLIVLTVVIAIYKRKLLKTSTLKTNLAQT